MKSAVKTNGLPQKNEYTKSLLVHQNGLSFDLRLTVQKALGKWYDLLNQVRSIETGNNLLFTELPQQELIQSLQTDIDLIPSILMDEMIATYFTYDKGQYIKLVQAQLINLSDCLYQKEEPFNCLCPQIENVLQFLQNFFYQYFDMDSRLPKHSVQQFCECAKLKLNYWRIKLNHPPLIAVLEECLADKCISPEDSITYKKINYLKYLIKEIESATTVLTESYIREIFIYNNFNSACFVNYEIELIKVEIDKQQNYREIISLLQTEQSRVTQLRIKPIISFDANLPSVKKQLVDWITEEIKQAEVRNNKAADKDLMIGTESKIQTSLSVAKLAVLIRLMVVDKIIINKSVAPMLRTITKLFTTLQKDEISFGSMETKYHAPDKNTINMMKDMLQKWVRVVEKL